MKLQLYQFSLNTEPTTTSTVVFNNTGGIASGGTANGGTFTGGTTTGSGGGDLLDFGEKDEEDFDPFKGGTNTGALGSELLTELSTLDQPPQLATTPLIPLANTSTSAKVSDSYNVIVSVLLMEHRDL